MVVVAIDRIGRTWQDTVRSICSLRDRGVKIRSLAEAEAQWTRYLEADEGSPESFFGQVLVMFAAWVADQELESIKRRTRDGLERARQQGKALGPPRKIGPGQLAAMRRMREGGASLRRIAGDFECSPSTVLRALRREGAVPQGRGCSPSDHRGGECPAAVSSYVDFSLSRIVTMPASLRLSWYGYFDQTLTSRTTGTKGADFGEEL